MGSSPQIAKAAGKFLATVLEGLHSALSRTGQDQPPQACASLLL